MRLIVFLLILFVTPLSAAIFHEIDTTKPLYCAFSSKHHNRIVVEEGRIKKLIFPEEKLFVRMEELSGQVFVQAKFQLQDPTLVSVVTNEGLVQDIEITFSDRPSQVIVLNEQSKNNSTQLITELPMTYPCQSCNTIIDTILHREIPPPYVSTPFQKCVWKPKSGLTAKLVGQLVGMHDELLIYEIKNSSWRKKKITEKEMTPKDGQWTYLEKTCLSAREKILAIVAVNRV